MLKVVIDTNVLVSALLKSGSVPDLVLSFILEKKLIMCLSQAIATEYEEVLERAKFKKLDRKEVKNLIARLKSNALWAEPNFRLEVAKLDPDDNKFLECAQAAGADFLVTGNTKHFPPEKFKKTRIATPAGFLLHIAKALADKEEK